ncbi:hypothetical protein ABZ801_40945 [Actinomadura sp. NPDC047616]|uniref:hypothetical protein n=1 Tax=Actinomadura sp. NPDC047616 TaxID=3155914 RepID=UPI0033DA46FE
MPVSDREPRWDLVDSIVSDRSTNLHIPDLDAGFGLQIRTMVGLSIPSMYEELARHVDVAGIRRRGLSSAVTFAEFERLARPLAVAAPLHTRVETRQCELSGHGLGHPAARLGFDIQYTFSSPGGRGDPLRYREITDPQPAPRGRGRLLLTLIRPFAPRRERLVTETPKETGHLRVHRLDAPHPTVKSLGAVSADHREIDFPASEHRGFFGRHHTDTNQSVFTGDYLSVMVAHATTLLGVAGLPVGRHSVERIAAVFKAPFSAGAEYVIRARLYGDGDSTVALVGLHAILNGKPTLRPAVFGRIEGTMDAG